MEFSRDPIVRIEWGRTGLVLDRFCDIATACTITATAIFARAEYERLSTERIVWCGGRGSMGQS